MRLAGVERIERFLLLHLGKKLIFLKGVNAMVSENVVSLLRELREFPVDCFQVAKFCLDGVSCVDQVTKFHDEIRIGGQDLFARFGQLRWRVSIMTCA